MINTVMLSAMAFIQNTIARIKEERGQDIIEYVILAGAIALVAGASLYFFVGAETFDNFAEKVESCLAFNDGDNCNID